ncbi:MAG TPA: hypothetical protein VK932_06245 [Kofleriaceae bacterium]|nr:hypothetical protein [Kofleriaceae bacterium]
MMWKTMGAVWLVLAVGCVAPEGPELEQTGEIEQHFEPCPGCGVNGMRQGEWNNVFSTLDKAALDRDAAAYDLWDGATHSPMGLCQPGTLNGGACTVREGWGHWINRDTNPRVGIFTNLVKVILPKGYKVVHPGGYTYWGKFGLMAHARTSSWGQEGREIASAGMLALLNAYPDVPLCLNTRQLPDNCVGSSAQWSESILFGDAIYGGSPRYIAISGGKDAPSPALNPRYGTVDGGSARAHSYYQYRCTTSRTGNARYPVSCSDNGVTWHNPVHVLTPGEPGKLYYDNPIENHRYDPASWPQPY